MRAFVDQELCAGCGMCRAGCPAVFAMNADGKAEVIADTTDENYDDVMAAIDGCPMGAIREEE